MKHAKINRGLQLPDHGTFGAMVLDAMPFCVTLEPYLGNLIPAGQYIGKSYMSPRFGQMVYLLDDVYRRTMIELHPGNIDDNTHGCILLAEHYGKLGADWAVVNSGATFKRFIKYMAGDTLFLTIKDCY